MHEQWRVNARSTQQHWSSLMCLDNVVFGLASGVWSSRTAVSGDEKLVWGHEAFDTAQKHKASHTFISSLNQFRQSILVQRHNTEKRQKRHSQRQHIKHDSWGRWFTAIGSLLDTLCWAWLSDILMRRAKNLHLVGRARAPYEQSTAVEKPGCIIVVTSHLK